MTRWNRALVTGASSGIGDAIARRLAADGTELVIVARDTARLEALAADLDTNVEVLTADLADSAQVELVAERLGAADSPIDLLVNNAGFGFVGNFAELDIEAEARVIAVNVGAVHRLSHAAASAMEPRGKGGILNVASVAGLVATAGGATYNATKAFVISMSDSLSQELSPKGIHVTALCPGFTRTEFQERAEFDTTDIPKMLWQSADDVARIGLAAIDKGRPRVVPGVPNKIGVGLARFLPAGIVRRLTRLLSNAD